MLPQDVRYAVRSLRRSPGFVAAVVLTLALGIGANTAIFSVLHGVVLSPLPFEDPNRLVVIALYNRALKHPTDLSYSDFLDWQRNSRSFQQMAAFVPLGYDLTNPGAPEHVVGIDVSAGFFQTLGVKLALGREFTDQEDRHGGTPVAVISDRLWRERWGASRAALGRTVTLNGSGYAIVGVLPPQFRFLNEQTDVYTPIGQGDPLQRTDRTIHNVIGIARLQPQLSLGQAQAEMNTVQVHIDDLNPTTERGQGIYMGPLQGFIVGDVGGTLLLLFGAVGLVLLIACANVANLLLARSLARTREFAVRVALGARRVHLARQLITESVLLSVTGGALGLAVAKWSLPITLAAAPGSLPRVQNIAVNAPALSFALGVSILVGILFGLLPVWKSSKTDPQTGLKDGGRGSTLGHQRMQRGLVVAQIAMAVVLLTGGSMLLRTIRNLWAADPGFNTQHVLTFQAGLSSSPAQTSTEIRTAYQQLRDRIRQIPGVEAADITALVPLSQHDNSGPFWIGPQPASMAEIPLALYFWIGPDYFHTMQIPLLRGRTFSPDDTTHSEPVIVIDSILARGYFGNRDPVGQTVTISHWATARVVGVVGHVRHLRLGGSNSLDEEPQIYASFYQLLDPWVPTFSKEVTFVLRTPLAAATLMPAIKNVVSGTGGGEPVYNVHSMQELVSGSMAPQRLAMMLLVAFAALALVLACLGVYGVMAYSMTRRTQEIGIRMVSGAERRDVSHMVIGQGFRLAVCGVGTGLVAALSLTRVLSSFSRLLYGVAASDPFTFLAVPSVLIAATIAACYIPARRAARLDPAIALRHE